MIYHLAYGKNSLDVDIPDHWNVTCIEPKFVPELCNPYQSLVEALRSPNGSLPLRELVNTTDKVGIIFTDITRATPNNLIIPAIIQELSHLPHENIILFNALGTHRPNTEFELRGLLGDQLVDQYQIVQNNAFAPATQIYLGETIRGHPIWVHRELMSCDLKILTGFIEPHFFAGFSGGGKVIMPGMAGQQTVLQNHGPSMISDPRSTWGVTWGNPIWEEIREVALLAGRIFLVNVSLNRERHITGIFAGDVDTAFNMGSSFVKSTAMVAVPHPFDIVVTSNSGYPLDLNLYQTVKGMSAAAQVVREGGVIILAADCWDGIPEHGQYGRILREASTPRELLNRINTPGNLEQDQWQAQIQAQILVKAKVYIYSHNLTDVQITSSLLLHCRQIEATLQQLHEVLGQNMTIGILPEGPVTIPYVMK